MKITFKETGKFKAIVAAQDWLKENGYSFGYGDDPNPIAIKKGKWNISKWHNLSAVEKTLMDGTIDGDFRNGPVVVTINNNQREYLLAKLIDLKDHVDSLSKDAISVKLAFIISSEFTQEEIDITSEGI